MKVEFLAIIAITSLAFFSCKKDSENPSTVLTSKIWKRGLNDKDPSTNPAGQVIYYPIQDCEKDDTFQFSANGNLVLNRNKDKCDLSESQTETKAYTLNRTTKELVIDGTTFTLADESNSQIKYYAIIPTTTGFQYLIYLLQ